MYVCCMSENDRIDIYEKSNNDIAVELGRRFKSYRIALKMTQQEIAMQSGVSVITVARFERGEAHSLRMDNFLALMRAIQKLEDIADIIPDIPPSLYGARRTGREVQRVRRRKDEE